MNEMETLSDPVHHQNCTFSQVAKRENLRRPAVTKDSIRLIHTDGWMTDVKEPPAKNESVRKQKSLSPVPSLCPCVSGADDAPPSIATRISPGY